MYVKYHLFLSCLFSLSFQGTCSVELPASNETYTWSNVNCVVHIIGTMWMEHQVNIL